MGGKGEEETGERERKGKWGGRDSLVLRHSNGTVGIIIIASHLCQVQGTHDSPEDDIEQLETLHILDSGHQSDCDSDVGTICLAYS